MTHILRIAAYCRISVDEELDRDNTSIENQKAIIGDYVRTKFPDGELSFYEDRDKSGYTFAQRPGYQRLRPLLMKNEIEILIVKDFSRFSRRNSLGLVELEELRDAGVRIISIGDSVDYPTNDEWMAIQFRFLINELPVTDASKKVKSVIKHRQTEGRWICSVPYGYEFTNTKTMAFKVDEPSAEIVREIFRLYLDGWGYKRIANSLTEKNIPTPRMCEKERKESKGEECKLKPKNEWSIITVQSILQNDFYIGTLRQGKYKRKKINGKDVKNDLAEHIVFEKNHEPIIDFLDFSRVQELMEKRSTGNYRGVKKYENTYSGYLFCGDCGSPMFSMSRADLAPAYTCGRYHRLGTKGCSSHHIRCDILDSLLKAYLIKIRDNSKEMLEKLYEELKAEDGSLKSSDDTVEILTKQIDDAKEELKTTKRLKIRDIMKKPDDTELIEATYRELEDDLMLRIAGLENQLTITADKRNAMVKTNRIAKTAIEIWDGIIRKDKLDKSDIDLLVERIVVFDNNTVEVYLKSDISELLQIENAKKKTAAANFSQGIIDTRRLILKSRNKTDKIYDVNVINDGDPLEIYTNPDGEVIFKKYSPVGEISDIASQYAEVLSKIGGCPAVICDRDHVIAASGIQKKEILERRVSNSLEDLVEQRKSLVYKSYEDKKINPIEGIDRYAIAATPILSQGDVSGTVLMLSGEGTEYASPEHTALVQAAAMYFGKQMEE